LTGTTSAAGGANVAVFNYAYNSANQRTTITNVDNSRWVYQYDSLGQVTSGRKYWSDGSTVAGQQFDYTFDDIGNRKTTTRDTRSATYTPNTLNQYTSRTVPGYVNVLGTATNTATVSLWSKDSTALFTPTSRKGNYFRGEMPFNNSTGAIWLTITNVAVLNNGTSADLITNTVGKSLLAKTPEAFTYDLDGNLTNDGHWAYTWDAENRLISMTNNTLVGPQYQLTFAYDAKGRRIQKIVATNDGTIYIPQTTNNFLYDGWNLLAEVGPDGTLIRTYAWGTDLSGSLQGAGGVGGLLWESEISNSQIVNSHFTAFDGNGNVAALVKASDGTVSANYEYSPFGELIRATGDMAKANPFRFSTKYQDDETDLLYYGHRYYDPTIGRWPNHDPINEIGFQTLNRSRRSFDRNQEKNLYDFIANNPINNVDLYGLLKVGDTFKFDHGSARVTAYNRMPFGDLTNDGDVGAQIRIKLQVDYCDCYCYVWRQYISDPNAGLNGTLDVGGRDPAKDGEWYGGAGHQNDCGYDFADNPSQPYFFEKPGKKVTVSFKLELVKIKCGALNGGNVALTINWGFWYSTVDPGDHGVIE
jgi:RHS repeat-associated protein